VRHGACSSKIRKGGGRGGARSMRGGHAEKGQALQ